MKFAHVARIQARTLLVGLIAGLALVACANQMEPAKKLIADIETAVAAAGADAQQYIPEQTAAVNQKLADLKAAFDKQDYKTVITTAPALLTEAKGLADAAAAKKKEVLDALNAQWKGLSDDLPQSVSTIEAKLATLAKTKKLPAGVTKDGVAAAQSGLAEVKTAWDDAKTAFSSGNVQGALDKAKTIKAKIDEISAKIGLTTAKPAA